MGTDWLIKVKCWKGMEKGKTEEDHVKECSKCPYVIWEEPRSVAGIFRTMCGVRVGNVYQAAELDDIGEKLTEIKCFTKEESNAAFKKNILEQVRNHAKKTGWSIKGLSTAETIEWLNTLIEFCKKADKKGLDISAWA